MPSDFEDEEIDEDMAFTEEDKKKYAAWFDEDEEEAGSSGGEEVSEEEDVEGDGSSEADMDMLDSDQEMEAGRTAVGALCCSTQSLASSYSMS